MAMVDDYDKLLTKIVLIMMCIQLLVSITEVYNIERGDGTVALFMEETVSYFFFFMSKLFTTVKNGEMLFMKNTSPSGDESLLYGCIIGDKDNPDAVLSLNSKLIPVGPHSVYHKTSAYDNPFNYCYCISAFCLCCTKR